MANCVKCSRYNYANCLIWWFPLVESHCEIWCHMQQRGGGQVIWSKPVLVWSILEIFVDSGQNQRLQYFRGWAKKRYRLIRSSYLMALGPRCFKCKVLCLSGTKALLFLHLLIDLLSGSVVNVCAISNAFFSVSLVTSRVSLEEVCLPSLTC